MHPLIRLMMKTKQEIRKEMAGMRRQVSAENRALWSAAVQEQIEKEECFLQADTVLAYYPMPDELDLRNLLIKWLGMKRLVLPIVVGDDIRLKVYEGEERMRPGRFGILEPDTEEWFEDWQSIDCILVPGVAFTPDGARMGRGKGYYDRFLPQVPKASKIGVCYPFQLVDEVPVNADDRFMDKVISGHIPE